MKLLVDKKCLLKKFSGKGGWVYAEIPEIKPNKNNPFGWVQISGNIDGFELKQYKLMPMGNGNLFLPVRAEIRKKIGKQAGDFISIQLYLDESSLAIPLEFVDCLKDEPKAYKQFYNLTESQQKTWLTYIFSVKTIDIQIAKIAYSIKSLLEGKKTPNS